MEDSNRADDNSPGAASAKSLYDAIYQYSLVINDVVKKPAPAGKASETAIQNALARAYAAKSEFIKHVVPLERAAALTLCFDITYWLYEGLEFAGTDWWGNQRQRNSDDIAFSKWIGLEEAFRDNLELIDPSLRPDEDGRPHFKPDYFSSKYGIPADRLRKARRRNRIRSIKVGYQHHYSFPDAHRLWPEDVPENP